MAEWHETTLDDLGEIFDGPHATPERRDSGPYFLNIASLSNGRLDLGQSDHVSRTDYRLWTRRVTPRTGDLLFSYETRLGEAALMPPHVEACLGRRMALLRPDEDQVDPRFLLYLYLSPAVQTTIERNTIHGATVNRIPLSTMGGWRVAIPSLPEQRAIAEVLGALDDKIAANTRLIATLEAFALAEAATVRSRIPLGAVVVQHKSPVDPARLGADRVAHFSLPAFDSGRSAEYVAASEIKSQKLLIGQPSVLVSKLNPRFPRVWDVPELPGVPALASTEFLVLEPSRCTSTMLWALMAQPEFGAALESKVAGTSGSHQRVRPDDLLNTPIGNPRDVHARTAALVTGLGLRAQGARCESFKLAATRDALLPALMSGRLRVRDAERAVSASV